jgi:hypothetical protein
LVLSGISESYFHEIPAFAGMTDNNGMTDNKIKRLSGNFKSAKNYPKSLGPKSSKTF